MQTVSDAVYEDLYKTAMAGIGFKVAMQAIRKILRDNSTDDVQKMQRIMTVVHSFESDLDK